MQKKPLNIGIVTSDPVIAAAIYDVIIADVSNYTQKCRYNPTVSLYSRRIDGDVAAQIYEGTELMRRLNMAETFFPDIKTFPEFDGVVNRTSVIIPNGLMPITPEMTSGIRDNILKKQPPVTGSAQRKRYDDAISLINSWGHFITAKTFSIADSESFVSIERNRATPNNKIAWESVNPARHKLGFVAIQGGQGPEAGNQAFKHVAASGNGTAILLVSEPAAVFDHSTFVEELAMHLPIAASRVLANATKRIQETNRKIASVNPDAKFYSCSTLHGLPGFSDHSGVDVVNIVEEGVRAVPRSERKVLLLATSTTLGKGIYHAAAENIGRNEIEFIIPRDEQQAEVTRAIFGEIIPGNISAGRNTLMQVISSCRNDSGKNIYVVAGCSDIPLAVGDVDKLIDPIREAAEKAILIAAYKASKRSGMVVIGRGIGGKNAGNTRS